MIPERIGRYRVSRQISESGMSAVFLANDPNVGREVALKVLPQHLTQNKSYLARFNREASIVASLDHPRIVPVYDFGVDGTYSYLVMRYMSGGSLADRIQPGGMSVRSAAQILVPLALALDEAHKTGVVHRDLKPSNILFDQRDEPAIADFGVGKLISQDETVTKAPIGTPAYMSPEQIEGNIGISARTDVYALGVILFEMVTGKRPFVADSSAAVMMRHVTAPVPKLRDTLPSASASLEAIITKALSKRPDARQQSAEAFAQELAQVAGIPIINDEQAFVTTGHSAKMNRFSALLLISILGAILALSVLGWSLLKSRSDLQTMRDTNAEQASQVSALRGEATEAWRTANGLATIVFSPTETREAAPVLSVPNIVNTISAGISATRASEKEASLPEDDAEEVAELVAQSVVATQAVTNAKIAELEIASTQHQSQLDDLYESYQYFIDGNRQEPIFYQASGVLSAQFDTYGKQRQTGVMLSEFVADVGIANPTEGDYEPWKVYLSFREESPDEKGLFVLDSNGDWLLQQIIDGEANTIDSGNYDRLRGYGDNHITVVANAAQGFIFLNEERISQFFFDAFPEIGTISLQMDENAGENGLNTEVRFKFFTIAPLTPERIKIEPTLVANTQLALESETYFFEAVSEAPIVNTQSGALSHDGEESVKFVEFGIEERNFVFDAEFAVPYEPPKGIWDAGILFRKGEETEYQLIYEVDGSWRLSEWQETRFITNQSGWLTDLQTAVGEWNKVRLVVRDDQGFFFFNEQLVAELDLSGERRPGDIAIAVGLKDGFESSGISARYRNVMIWSLP